MKSDNNRKYLLIFSAILLGYQYFDVVIDDTIPYTQIKISSQANILIILTLLIIFFGSQFTFYWLKQKKEDRSHFEFATSIPVGLIAIVPVCYGYLKNFGLDWKVICITICLLLLGSILAIAVSFTIDVLVSLRSPEEMEKLGLGKVPSASKAFLRWLMILFPLNALVLFVFMKFSYMLPLPLNSYWLSIFLSPTLVWNFGSFINLLKCLGPPKVRKKALENLRIFQRAMDLHEMHYQYLGIEDFKDYEKPLICEYAQNGNLDEIQKLLNNGENPDIQDKRGWCPLMWTAAEGHLNIVELLLEHGADPNIINYLGRSAIMYASNYGYYKIAKALVEKGATPNPTRELMDHPPLSAAANQGHIEVVKLLVEHAANVLYKDEGKESALDIAMEAGHGDVAKYLRNIMLEADEKTPEDKTNLTENIDWIGKKPTE